MWANVVIAALLGLVVGFVVGYNIKSAKAHEAARRRRLNRVQRRTAAAMADVAPRQSVADVRRTDRPKNP